MLPDEYKTGNKKMDEAIARSMIKDPQLFKPVIGLGKFFEKLKINKYNVSEKDERTYKDGTLFASKTEMERWDVLVNAQRGKLLKDLRRQVEFILQEDFISRQHGEVGPIIYVADFTYTNISFLKGIGERKIVEDSKAGIATPVYKLKRKMFLYRYGGYLFYEV